MSFVIRLLYALCLARVTCNHARIVLEHGLMWDYGGVPLFVSTFWTARTFVDALAVIFLFVQHRYGVALTVAIIVSDVAMNAWVDMVFGIDVATFAAQVVFLLFVLFTVRRAWHAVER